MYIKLIKLICIVNCLLLVRTLNSIANSSTIKLSSFKLSNFKSVNLIDTPIDEFKKLKRSDFIDTNFDTNLNSNGKLLSN